MYILSRQQRVTNEHLEFKGMGSLVGVEGEGGGNVSLQEGGLLDDIKEGLVNNLLVSNPGLIDGGFLK